MLKNKKKIISQFSIISVILSIIFFSTNRLLSYEDALASGFTDIKSYYYIASDVLLNAGDLGFSAHIHIIERWPLYKLIGYFSDILNLDIWILFKALVILLVGLSILIINSLKTSDRNKIAIFSFILFNPYTFRSYYAVGMVGDCAFFVSILLITCGIINKSSFQIIIGSVAAIIFRQSAILLVPIFIFLFYFKYVSKKTMFFSSLSILIGFTLIKFSTYKFFMPYDSIYTSFYLENIISIFSWIINKPKLDEAISFFGRYVYFLATLGCLSLCLNKLTNPKLLITFLGIFFFMHLQPLGGGPLSVGNNIQRLCSLGLPFLLPLIVQANFERKSLYFFVAILIMTSFHHNTSILYYFNGAKPIFFTLVILSFIFSIFSAPVLSNCFKNKPKFFN